MTLIGQLQDLTPSQRDALAFKLQAVTTVGGLLHAVCECLGSNAALEAVLDTEFPRLFDCDEIHISDIDEDELVDEISSKTLERWAQDHYDVPNLTNACNTINLLRKATKHNVLDRDTLTTALESIDIRVNA